MNEPLSSELLLSSAIAVDLQRIEQLEKALRELLFAARTSGGVAGRDEALCNACEHAEFMLTVQKHIHDDDGTVEGCPGCFP
jgi:hypothetical protein